MQRTSSKRLFVLAPFLACAGALAMALMFHVRALPFLRSDTIVSGGRLVPTQDFADFSARMFLYFALFSFLIGLVQVWYSRRSVPDQK